MCVCVSVWGAEIVMVYYISTCEFNKCKECVLLLLSVLKGPVLDLGEYDSCQMNGKMERKHLL